MTGVIESIGISVLFQSSVNGSLLRSAGKVLQKGKLTVYRVSEYPAFFGTLHANSIPEAFFVGVGEDELPRLAAVGGFVEAGLVAGAGGHDDGGVFVEGLDAAEVEFFGSGRDGAGLPEVAAVFGAEYGAVCSAGPGDSSADAVDATEADGGVGLFEVELGVSICSGEGCREEKDGGEAGPFIHKNYGTVRAMLKQSETGLTDG